MKRSYTFAQLQKAQKENIVNAKIANENRFAGNSYINRTKYAKDFAQYFNEFSNNTTIFYNKFGYVIPLEHLANYKPIASA